MKKLTCSNFRADENSNSLFHCGIYGEPDDDLIKTAYVSFGVADGINKKMDYRPYIKDYEYIAGLNPELYPLYPLVKPMGYCKSVIDELFTAKQLNRFIQWLVNDCNKFFIYHDNVIWTRLNIIEYDGPIINRNNCDIMPYNETATYKYLKRELGGYSYMHLWHYDDYALPFNVTAVTAVNYVDDFIVDDSEDDE
jgi:hypothetical protein